MKGDLSSNVVLCTQKNVSSLKCSSSCFKNQVRPEMYKNVHKDPTPVKKKTTFYNNLVQRHKNQEQVSSSRLKRVLASNDYLKSNNDVE